MSASFGMGWQLLPCARGRGVWLQSCGVVVSCWASKLLGALVSLVTLRVLGFAVFSLVFQAWVVSSLSFSSDVIWVAGVVHAFPAGFLG